MSDFTESLIPITLTGKEWFVVASVLADQRVRQAIARNNVLSPEGASALARAKKGLADALQRASTDFAASGLRSPVVVPFSGREL